MARLPILGDNRASGNRRDPAVDHPTDLILQDVRCFEGEQRGPLRPITLLVGENSTGKTTFLGCYDVLHRMFSEREFTDLSDFDDLPDFNQEPFAMGSFRDIARSRRGPSGRINEFKLGLALEASQNNMPCSELTATFREEGSQPIVSTLRFQFGHESFLELERSDEGTSFHIPGHSLQKTHITFGQAMSLLSYLTAFEGVPSGLQSDLQNLKPVFEYLFSLRPRSEAAKRGPMLRRRIPSYRPQLSKLIPVAPLRSKPKRTYDPVRETASPEGEHIPMLMMRLDRTDKAHWGSLHDDLVEFGRSSGLFSDIKVKRHGKQMSDPFQLQVKVRSGPHANIMDVGYGISQSLPILVDVMAAEGPARRGVPRRAGGRTFLLQQPEVHLHPKGQAQLASLFIEAFKKRRHRFLIETHSDYILDRIRISVRQSLLKPNEVSILYFEPNGNAVNIHSMGLDAHGNVKGAPAGYRDFFSKETDQLLGFAD